MNPVHHQLVATRQKVTSLMQQLGPTDVAESEDLLIVVHNLSDAQLLALRVQEKQMALDAQSLHLESLRLDNERKKLELAQLSGSGADARTSAAHDLKSRREQAAHAAEQAAHEAQVRALELKVKQLELAEKEAQVQLSITHAAREQERITLLIPKNEHERFALRCVREAVLGNLTVTEENPYRPFAAVLYLECIERGCTHEDALRWTMRDVAEEVAAGVLTAVEGEQLAALYAQRKRAIEDRDAKRREDEARERQERLKNDLAPGGLDDSEA